jgi:hypothetical protein
MDPCQADSSVREEHTMTITASSTSQIRHSANLSSSGRAAPLLETLRCPVTTKLFEQFVVKIF